MFVGRGKKISWYSWEKDKLQGTKTFLTTKIFVVFLVQSWDSEVWFFQYRLSLGWDKLSGPPEILEPPFQPKGACTQ